MNSDKSVENLDLSVLPSVAEAPDQAVSPLLESGGAALRKADFSDLLPKPMQDFITLIPAELVALHTIQLPVRTARQRRDALPFALEDSVGRPLDFTHFALCGISTDGTVLAASMEAETLASYLALAPDTSLVPEQMILQTPDCDADGKDVWCTYRRGDRVLVRVSDGTGFPARIDMLRSLWIAAGKPTIDHYGTPLASDIAWTDNGDSVLPQLGNLIEADLRQGAFRPSRGLGRPLKWLAAGIAVAALGHLAIAALDLRAQRTLADGLRANASASLAIHLANATVDDPPEVILRRLAARNQPQVGSTFLPTLDRVAQALANTNGTLQFRQINWDDDVLRLTIEAPDLDTLQQAEASLRAVDLQVSSGSATVNAGAARADLTVRP